MVQLTNPSTSKLYFSLSLLITARSTVSMPCQPKTTLRIPSGEKERTTLSKLHIYSRCSKQIIQSFFRMPSELQLRTKSYEPCKPHLYNHCWKQISKSMEFKMDRTSVTLRMNFQLSSIQNLNMLQIDTQLRCY